MLWPDYVRHLKVRGVTDRYSSWCIKSWIKHSSISTRTFVFTGKSLDFIKVLIKHLAITWLVNRKPSLNGAICIGLKLTPMWWITWFVSKILEKPLRWYLRLSFLLSKQCNRHLARLYSSLCRDLMRIEAPHYLIGLQRTIGLTQQLLKLQFSNTITPELNSNLLFLIVLICFLYVSITFFDIHHLFSRQEAVLQEHQWLLSCYSEPWYLYLVNFSFQAHRSKLKNFQTHKRGHSLFGNSHLLQFLQYFQ